MSCSEHFVARNAATQVWPDLTLDQDDCRQIERRFFVGALSNYPYKRVDERSGLNRARPLGRRA